MGMVVSFGSFIVIVLYFSFLFFFFFNSDKINFSALSATFSFYFILISWRILCGSEKSGTNEDISLRIRIYFVYSKMRIN